MRLLLLVMEEVAMAMIWLWYCRLGFQQKSIFPASTIFKDFLDSS
jgi:hypothetical protein